MGLFTVCKVKYMSQLQDQDLLGDQTKVSEKKNKRKDGNSNKIKYVHQKAIGQFRNSKSSELCLIATQPSHNWLADFFWATQEESVFMNEKIWRFWWEKTNDHSDLEIIDKPV